MITVQVAAAALLVIRLISLCFVIAVVLRQLKLFRLRVDSELVAFRAVMFMLGLALLLGSAFPIYIDVFYSVIETNATWNGPLVLYATSNALTSLVASILLWNIYRIAGGEIVDRQEKQDARDVVDVQTAKDLHELNDFRDARDASKLRKAKKTKGKDS